VNRPGRRRAWFAKAFGSAAALLSLVGAYAVPAIRRLRMRNELYYGGQTGFGSDTVDSLIRCWLYVQPYSAALKPVLWALVALVLAVGILIAVVPQPGQTRPPPSLGLLRALMAILVLGGVGTILQHAWFHTPFLLNRTASWMLPVFLLVLSIEVEMGLSSSARFLRAASTTSGWIVAAVCALHASLCANTRYAVLQYHDADTKEMLRDLGALHGSGTGQSLSLRSSWELTPAIEYYRVTRPLKWLGPVTDVPGPSDAAFVSPKDLGSRGALVIWKRYPTTGNTLLLAPGRFPPRETPSRPFFGSAAGELVR
jgi:hypothetical protein